MKTLLFLLLAFSAQGVFAQCDNSLTYSELQKESFVQIYLAEKKERPKSQDQLLFDIAAKYKVTPQQYKEIQNPQNANRALSSTERKFVSEINDLKKNYEQQIDELILKLCDDNKLSQDDYMDMKHQFRSCMRFQRSLSDYFNKWMK